MALPPKGDPRRPLHLAVRSMRVFGGFLLLLTTCSALSFAFSFRAAVSIFSIFYVLGLLMYLVPCVCFIIFSIYLARYQFWAVVASLCLTSIVALLMLFGLAGVVFAALTTGTENGILWIIAGFEMLVVAAIGQLIYHLAKSFKAIEYGPPGERGFEPIMAEPILGKQLSEDGQSTA